MQRYQNALGRTIFDKIEQIQRATDNPINSKDCEWGLHLYHRNGDIMHLIHCPKARPEVVKIVMEDFRGRTILSETCKNVSDWSYLLKEVRSFNHDQEKKLDERYRQLKEKNMG